MQKYDTHTVRPLDAGSCENIIANYGQWHCSAYKFSGWTSAAVDSMVVMPNKFNQSAVMTARIVLNDRLATVTAPRYRR